MQIQICTKRNIQIHIQVHFYMQWQIQCGFKDKYKCGEGGPDMRQGNIAQRTQALRPGAQICICSFVPTRIFGLLKCASDLLFQETCLVITGTAAFIIGKNQAHGSRGYTKKIFVWISRLNTSQP